MKVILCLDDNKGLLFNNRRQSRDKAVLDDIFNGLNQEMLTITSFSEKLFADYNDKLVVDDNPFENESNTNIFAENLSLQQYFTKIDEIIVYNWNREYPCDFYCDVDFSQLMLIEEKEFTGNSHEKITKRIFKRS
jgi:hypothetical protein